MSPEVPEIEPQEGQRPDDKPPKVGKWAGRKVERASKGSPARTVLDPLSRQHIEGSSPFPSTSGMSPSLLETVLEARKTVDLDLQGTKKLALDKIKGQADHLLQPLNLVQKPIAKKYVTDFQSLIEEMIAGAERIQQCRTPEDEKLAREQFKKSCGKYDAIQGFFAELARGDTSRLSPVQRALLKLVKAENLIKTFDKIFNEINPPIETIRLGIEGLPQIKDFDEETR